MSEHETGGQAFPSGMVRKSRPPHDPGADFHVTDILSPENQGMTLRQYAAIKLRVPDSGTYWLDEMIERSVRDELAAKAMQGWLSSYGDEAKHPASYASGMFVNRFANDAYALAEAMMEESES